MGPQIHFSQDDALEFAEWSGDRNPLHVDPRAAARSVFGRPVVHGILTTIRTLAAARPASEAPVRTLAVEFRHAVHPEVPFTVAPIAGERGAAWTARAAGETALTIRLNADEPGGAPQSGSWLGQARNQTALLRREPAPIALDALQPGQELVGRYSTASVPSEYLGDGALQPQHVRVLALCSYLIGMEIPGLRSLFTRFQLSFPADLPDDPDLLYRVRVLRIDPHFRLLDLSLEVAAVDGRPLAWGELRAYVRFTPIEADAAWLASRLSPESRHLAGRVAFVIGGTRGLGAEITTALAMTGCDVYASYHHDSGAADELRRALGAAADRVRFVQGDAANREWCAATLSDIQSRHRQLDLLVLNACAPPANLRFNADTADAFGAYISNNLPLAQVPLAACLPALTASRGTVVAVSSSFVADPPAGFGHYVSLKQALESTVRTAVRESTAVRALLARPPRLRTAWNDTPTGVIGTIPARDAAVHIVNAVAAAGGREAVTVLSEFPELPADDRAAPASAAAPQLAVSLAASFTADPLVDGFDFWFRELGLDGQVHVAPYGQIVQTLLSPSAPSGGRAAPTVVMLRLRDWLRELRPEDVASDEFVRAYLDATAQDFERAMRTHRGHASSETILVFCPSAARADDPAEHLLATTEQELHHRLAGLPGLSVIRAADFHAAYGVAQEAIADPVREHIAHIPYQTGYLYTLATIAMRHVHRKLVLPRKVVAVDCDNTLWSGVVGEVGAEGVAFDDGHRALHQTLTRLADNGVLVALCSKNEEADVWRVFDTRPELGFPRDKVIAAAVNWQPKSANLRAIADRLNLGLDAFIFIDDNPVECAEVRLGCPQVLTLQWLQDPAKATLLLRHTWELDAREATTEDRRRTELYKEEFRRQELQSQALTFKEFIASLDLVADIEPLAPEDLKRASQLTLRTNQFNFMTRRRNEAELQALIATGTHDVLTVKVRDRFGDYGLVGLVIAEQRGGEVFADTFLLSCRVLGRGVEHRMVAALGRLAANARASVVRLRVEPTKRNTPARMFLQSIAGAGSLRDEAGAIELELSADVAGVIAFEPSDAAPEAITDNESPKQPAAADDDAVRRREEQISRSAFELNSAASLAAAINGTTTPATAAADAAVDTEFVFQAFARALGISADEVKRIDSLEALGCDSFKIVEITVALLDKFPQLPGTLLFEHRRASEIAAHIQELSGSRQDTVTPAAHRTADPPAAIHGDIAVVGMHVRCAGADSPQQLWDLLSEGRVAVTPVPSDRQFFFGTLDDERPHFAGLLSEIDRFDAELFGITPREAEVMDPQLRLFLEVAWSALEDAGCLGGALDPETGVFAGVMYGDYAAFANPVVRRSDNPFKCWEGFSLANRLSQVFGFRGPSLAVDTACSSSATAVHLACRALAAGDCRVAIAGGVNLILDPDRFVQLGRLGILSPSGRCLAFGAEADGTVLGEGAGVVVLKRLEDAVQRGDRIYGVIKSTGVSTGSGTVGFTAPNPVAQSEAIRRSLAAAQIDPRTITYVESHGTGTALGDPIEIRGLMLAYQDQRLWQHEQDITAGCSIGSIKPNIGHLEAGAGVMGLIKLLMQLERRMLLPSVTSPEPNPQIPFSETSFSIQRTRTPWNQPVARVNGRVVAVPRRGALNSFGVGGANVHVVVEEPPVRPQDAVENARPVRLLAVSARSADALHDRLEDVANRLSASPDQSLDDLCFSLNTGQRHLSRRMAVVARTQEEMIRALRELARDGHPAGTARGTVTRSGESPQIAFLFTGQGSQIPGMGRELYDTHPVFKATLDRCFELFGPLLPGGDLRAIMFAREGTPEAALLNQTGFTQPALFSLGYALSELWKSWGLAPAAVVGHSIGEITAMCAAGGLSLEDAVTMVAARGHLMQALPSGGAMVSVMTSEARALAAIAGLEDQVAIAAINAPAQVVISGEATALEAVRSRLEADGVKTKALTVSHAFHSPLMRPMLEEYERRLRRLRFVSPKTTFVSTVLGRIAGSELLQPAYWLRNVTDAVRFTDSVTAMNATGATAFIEMGPQPILLGLARQSSADDGIERLWLPSARKDGSGWNHLLNSLAQLYIAGSPVDWRAFDAPYPRRRVSLPPYRFKGRRHWIAADRSDRRLPAARPTNAQRDGRSADLYEVAWRPQPGSARSSKRNEIRRWVIIDNGAETAIALVRELERGGARATILPTGALTTESAVSPFQADGRYGVVYLVGSTDARAAHDIGSAAAARTEETLAVMRTVASAKGTGEATLWIVTRDGVHVPGVDHAPVNAVHGAAVGAARTFALEHRRNWGALFDVPASMPAVAAAAAIALELQSDVTDDQLAIRPNGRFVPRLAPVSPAASNGFSVRRDRSYIVTGGLGALGLHTARWLGTHGATHLVLTGRRGLTSPGATDAVRQLESSGMRVTIVAADTGTAAGIDAILAAVPANAPLAGIFHTAGIDDTTPILELKPGAAAAVMSGKVTGAWLLHERTRDLPIDAFVCFSSIASVLGSAGRPAYAAANAFLDALAHERKRQGLRAATINWGPWSGGGMATAAALDQYRRAGNVGLDPDQALESMATVLAAGLTQGVIADIDWETFGVAYESSATRSSIISELRTAPREESGEEHAGRPQWIERLERLPAELRLAELTSLIQAEVAETLGLEQASEVGPEQIFREIGMDSLMSADFAQRLQKRLGIRSTALVFEHPTASRLAAHLIGTLTLKSSGIAVEAATLAVAAVGRTESIPLGLTDPGPTARVASRPGVADDAGGLVDSGTERYQANTESEVFDFQQTAFPTRPGDLIPSRWRWMFLESARRLERPPQVWLHRQDGRIVGHNGAIPVRLKINGIERDTAWLVDTMVLPEYRDHAVGARLMVEAHEDLPFALSLGQTQQMRDIQLRLGWQQVAPLETAQLLLRPERVLKGKLPKPAAVAAGLALRAGSAVREALKRPGEVSVREIARFDESHDRLWAEMAAHVTCAVRRDASYLNWKYVDQPGQEFLRLEVATQAGARGVVILMFREPDDAYQYRRAFIVDLVAALGDETLMSGLLSAAVRAAADHGADSLSCLHINSVLSAALQREGFRMRPPTRYLLVRPDGLESSLRDRLLDPAAWLVTQGDSDIDRPW